MNVEIMIYVDNEIENAKFFKQAFGGSLYEETMFDESKKMTLVLEDSVSLVFFKRSFIEQVSPEVLSNRPSLLFQVENVEDVYRKITNLKQNVSELSYLESKRTFNFSDLENNYYAIIEKKYR
ncbi:MAG: hypothetical protein RR565_09165 [Erysipelothrix sp.]